MTDDDLSALFRAGTAPECDNAFDRRVAATIGRLRFRTRLLRALGTALQGAATIAAAGALFLVLRTIEPWAIHLLAGVRQLMGLPAPLAIAALAFAAMLVARARRRERMWL